MKDRWKKIFAFGESREGYAVPVLNERELRAAAGILFACALIGASIVWQSGNLEMTRLFVVAFMIDFTIRVFVNPKYAPSIILGKIATINQQPEYVGAPQKRFAWGLGLGMAVFMFFSLIIFQLMHPINIAICLICLTLLFMETAFGICVGCKMYGWIPGKKPEACPGGVCSMNKNMKRSIPVASIAILIVFFSFLYLINPLVQDRETLPIASEMQEGETDQYDCEAPDWAVEIGHGDIWLEHHGCRNN